MTNATSFKHRTNANQTVTTSADVKAHKVHKVEQKKADGKPQHTHASPASPDQLLKLVNKFAK